MDESNLSQPSPSSAQSRSVFMHPEGTERSDRDIFGNRPKHHRDWSHRRGEPRVFTLLWMVYLMGSTVLMFSSMAVAYSISPDITRPAARSMLVVVIVGFSILWPMIRFSQIITPRANVRFAIRDAVVIFVPMQAVLWPQTMSVLAGWPLEVVAAVSVFFLAWVIIIAGVIAIGSNSIDRNRGQESIRIAWMIILVLIVLGAPIIGGLYGFGAQIGVDEPRVGWLLSPVSGFFELVRDRQELGTSTRIFSGHWRMIIALLCVGTALLLIARALEVARMKYSA